MKISKLIKNSSFAIYGLGLSGKSALKFLKKKNVKKIVTWAIKKIKIIKKDLTYSKKL